MKTRRRETQRAIHLRHFTRRADLPGHRVVWVKRHEGYSVAVLVSWRCSCGLTSYLDPPTAAHLAWAEHLAGAEAGKWGGPDAPADDYRPLFGMRPWSWA